ncbi:MAG: elongation factor Ts [Spirochaetaceae bacterium]|nr:elongation factor Ts [Spirochaetaceae bacterium]
MDIKASDVKALRDRTGAGMMECKNALVECNGDADAAEKLLKEKGLAAVEKRAGRATSEGRIFIATNDSKAVICEITCETDFVAKNADFIAVGNSIAEKALANNYSEVNEDLSNMLLDLATKIRENMTIRRVELVEVPANATVAKYIHSDGKTGVVTVIDGAKNNDAVAEFAYDCCLHIAAFLPTYIKREDVPADYIAAQKEIFVKQTEEKDGSKPEAVRAKIVEGKINKHLAEICFLDQPFVKDDKVSVSKKLEAVGKEAGAALSLGKVVVFQLGA